MQHEAKRQEKRQQRQQEQIQLEAKRQEKRLQRQQNKKMLFATRKQQQEALKASSTNDNYAKLVMAHQASLGGKNIFRHNSLNASASRVNQVGNGSVQVTTTKDILFSCKFCGLQSYDKEMCSGKFGTRNLYL